MDATGSPQQTTPLPLPGYPGFNPAAPPAGLSTLAVNRNDKNQQIQEWNLQLEQQLTSHDVLDIAYVGTKSDHLSTYYNYNLFHFGTGLQNFPTFGTITYNNYNGTANYNGLQLHFEHHQGNNLLVTASYAWSHALDDSPGSEQGSTAALYYDPQADYGNSLQDERQCVQLVDSVQAAVWARTEVWQRCELSDQPVDWRMAGERDRTNEHGHAVRSCR